jgi:hypothetical protein
LQFRLEPAFAARDRLKAELRTLALAKRSHEKLRGARAGFAGDVVDFPRFYAAPQDFDGVTY